VSVVTGGARDCYGKQKPFTPALRPTKQQKAKPENVKKAQALRGSAFCCRFRYADANKIRLLLVFFVVFTLRG
jgi:hypothetical protein